MGPLELIEHVVIPLTRDTLFGPHDLGKQPKRPSFAMHSMDDVQSVRVMRRLL